MAPKKLYEGDEDSENENFALVQNDEKESEDEDDDWELEESLEGETAPAIYQEKSPTTSSRHLNIDPKDPLAIYMKEVSRFKLLSPEEEKQLTDELIETGDIEVAKKLVQANLRLVVKIAMEYRHAYQNVLDLIQEGNIGLMKAVSKYDREKGAKLSYYASWWIRSYILKFILDNFRLVKIGTTTEQKKLFYNLMKEKNRLEQLGIGSGSMEQTRLISQNLGVSQKSVELMDKRLSGQGGEVSLDAKSPQHDDEGATLANIIPSEDIPVDEALAYSQGMEILQHKLKDFMGTLKERDLEIFKQRLMSEVPPSLQKLADDYGVSRERIRQIEERLMGKLKEFMREHIY